ncbi:hypothetical protein [Cytobacillus massiliigabonensis]|uniref:hypothetical protein n=1 Tax=Cytobacillus massiliigabonensis TaxID=1871011 RepID=UPI000C867DCB|nr:hypothetical protein [Cytobacillus massiliigabonensis]
MEEKNQKHLAAEADPLTSFMFGKSKYRRTTEEINDIEKNESQDFDHAFIRKRERDWLFGIKVDAVEEKKKDLGALAFLNRINLGELIENIEILVDSADQLKPLYKKATPLISHFLKKS